MPIIKKKDEDAVAQFKGCEEFGGVGFNCGNLYFLFSFFILIFNCYLCRRIIQ